MLLALRMLGLALVGMLVAGRGNAAVFQAAQPTEVMAWTRDNKDQQCQAARQWSARLAAAVAAKAHRFVIPPGDYRFSGPGSALRLRGVNDLEIEAKGVTFWIEPSQKALELNDCQRVTIRGLNIDYDPLPFVQARVLSLNPRERSITVEVAEGYPLPVGSFVKRAGAVKALFFEPEGKRMRNPALDWLATARPVSGRVFALTFVNHRVFAPGVNVVPGDWLALPDRDQSHTIVSADCEALLFDQITLYGSASFGFVEHGGKGNNVYRDCRLALRPGTTRVLACNADGFHSLAVAHGPTIEGCDFGYAGDDFINIHGYFDVSLGQSADGRALVLHQYHTPLEAGAQVATFDLDSVGLSAGAKVLEAKILEQGPTAFQAAEALRERLKKRGIVLRDFVNPEVLSVRLSTGVVLPAGTLICLPGYCGSHATIRNCFLHDTIARGMLIGGEGTVIEGNRIERTGMAGIVIGSERYWLEARPASQLAVTGNQLVDCGGSLSSVGEGSTFPGALCVLSGGPHFHPVKGRTAIDLTIHGNRIVRPAAAGIFVFGLAGGQITDNEVEGPQSSGRAGTGSALGLGSLDFAIALKDSPGVIVDRNRMTAFSAVTQGGFHTGSSARLLSSP